MPDSSITGIINAIPEMSMAATCVSEMVEMSSPKHSDTKIKMIETSVSEKMLPATGTWSTNTESTNIVTRLMNESTKYGTAFAMMIFNGFIGDTSSTSMVPVSFSLTIEMEVIMAHININIMPITPGTKLKELFMLGL
jgi:hypothetical protein